jgi:hypothetical protein
MIGNVMKPVRKRFSAILVFIFGFSISVALAQSASQKQFVSASGGGASASANFEARGVIGESVSGPSGNANYAGKSGFYDKSVAPGIGLLRVTPDFNSIALPTTAQFEITFETALEPGTVNSNNVFVFGSQTGSMPAAITLVNDDSTIKIITDSEFGYGENVTVVVTKNVSSIAGDNLDQSVILNYDIATLDGPSENPALHSPEMISFGNSPTMVAIGDINGDGNSDVVIALTGEDRLSWHAGDGTGNFGPAQDIQGFVDVKFLSLADAEGDGDLDIYAGNDTDIKIINNEDGLGTSWLLDWENDESLMEEMTVLLNIDFNGDGIMDFITDYSDDSGSDGTVFWAGLPADANKNGRIAQRLMDFNKTTTRNYTAFAVGDVDRDGDLDLVSAFTNSSGNHKIKWRPNINDDDTFPFASSLNDIVTVADRINHIEAGDFNNDGWLDIIYWLANNTLHAVYYNPDNGNWDSFELADDLNAMNHMAAGDLNNDGNLDLLMVFNKEFKWLSNTGVTNGFGEANSLFVTPAGSPEIFHFALGDLDGDADADVVFTDRSNDNISWLTSGAVVVPNTQPDVGSGPGVDHVVTFDVPMSATRPLLFAEPVDADGDVMTITVTAIPDPAQGIVHLSSQLPVDKSRIGAKVEDVIVPLAVGGSIDPLDLSGLEFTASPGFTGAVDDFEFVITDGKGIIKNIHDGTIQMTWLDQYAEVYRASGQATSSGVNFACRMADDRDVIIQVRNGSSDIRDWTLQKVGGVTIDIADLEMQPNEIVYVNAGPYDGQNATFRLVGDNAPGGTTTAGAGDLKLAEDMVGTAVVTVTSAITVTSNADSGPGSLREAIENANTDPGPDTVRFAAIFDWGNNPIVLQSALPNINDDGTYINGDIDDDGLPDVLLDGGGVVSRGLGVNADDIKIRGLAFVNFTSSAISFGGNSKNLWIVGNHLGVGLDGNTAGSNNGDHGISGSWFESVHIGDGTVKGRNVISGHTKDGISISNIDSTFIFGNIVGLGRTNDTAIPNTWHGISLDNGINYAEIGNGTATGRNIISGNGQLGVYIDQPTDVTIKGNYFGTNVAGLANRDNGWGSLFFRDGFNVVIGDSTQLGRNVMAGTCDVYNEGLITFHSMDSTRIFGNFIGVGADGETPLYVKRGIYVEYSNSRVSIGGHRPMERNVIANAEEDGIKLFRADSVIIQGNYIGVDSTGTIARGNAENGIFIADESSNTRIFENIIANNGQSAIRVSSAEADSNTFVENYIYDNSGPGIFIDAGSQQNIAAPQLSYVDLSEILHGEAAPAAVINVYADFGAQARYFVGTTTAAATGDWSLPLNIALWPEAYTHVTATQDSAGNTSAFASPIAASPGSPLLVTKHTDDGSLGTLRFAIETANTNSGPDTIRFDPFFDWANNPILVDALLPIITDDSTVIIGNVDPDVTPDVTIINNYSGADNDLRYGFQIRSAYNEIRGFIFSDFDTFDDHAVLVYLNDAHFNTIAGNYFGLNADGSVATGNYSSVSIFSGARYNTVGGYALADGNVIAGSSDRGIYIEGSEFFPTAHNKVINNFIGIGKDGEILSATQGIGIEIQRADSNRIGDGTAAGRNFIAGNTHGIRISGEVDDPASYNTISGNYIGTDTSGTASRPNTNGIFISEHATGNSLGDGSLNGGNLISGNTSNGIYIERGGDQTSILGNIIGLSSNGLNPLPNGSNGIEIQGNTRDILGLAIGNGTPDGRNVIAANNDWNLKIFKTDNCNIYGNYIGTDTDGNTRINNEGAIQFRNSINSLIQGNVIGGFDRWGGLYLADNDSLIISANRIGIGADGASDISAVDGILVASEPEGINLIRGEKTHIGTGEISNANYIGNFYKGIVVGADVGVTNIAGNVIGLEADGETAASNNFGLVIHSDGNHINRNVISANESYGVQIFSNNNIVIRNTVGPVLSGNAPVTGANQSIGLMLWDAGSNQIGGNNYTDANIFADNQNGLAISGGDNNTVTYNRFGIGFDGTTPLPNSGNGIRIYRTANGNLLAHNQIVGSGDNGIWVDGSDDAKNNNFNVNSIFANNSGGIEIINGGQNGVVSPIINQINSDSLLSGVAAPEALVLLYADELNQGELFLDSVRADINGDWIYKVGLDTIPGRYVSFTALQDSFGNTSAFSAPLQINLPPVEVAGNALDSVVAIEDFNPIVIDLNDHYEDPEDAGLLSFNFINTTEYLLTNVGINANELTFTSVPDRFGKDTLILQIVDVNGLMLLDSVVVNVTPVNDAPVVVSPIADQVQAEDFAEYVVVDLSTVFSDPDLEALNYIPTLSVPDIVTAIVDGSDLKLAGVADASGMVTVTVRAEDAGLLFVEDSFDITLTAVNDAPVVDVTIANLNLNEDFASPHVVVADLNANFSDPESQALSFSASSDDESVVTVNVDGNKLELNAVADASGSAIITVTADDGAAVNNTVSTSFTVTIDAVNDAPVVVNPIAAVTLNEDFASPHEVVADLNANFSDPESQALSFSASSDDESVVTVNVDGNKLELNAVADASGSAIITVTADDGAAVNNTVSTSFTMTIDAVNDAPVVVNPIAAVTLNEDFASPHEVVADLNANFSDPESQALSFSASSDDESVVTVNVDGNKLELNAVADAFGTATITVTADDGAAVNNTVSTSFTVTIDAVNDAPVVVNPIAAVTLNEDFASPHEVVADLNANFSDPESQALSFSASSDDESVVTVNVDGNKLELNAVADASGSAIITVTADDGAAVNNTVSTSFTVTIDAVNDAPVVVNPIAAVTLNEDFASPHVVVADLNANFSDPESQALSFSASSDDESVVTVNVDGNKLELNAVADASGSAIITVTADDGAAVNNTVSTSFTVTIDAVNDAPVVVNPIAAVTLNEDFASPHEVVADLNANFSDPESQALSFSASSDDESVVTVNVDGDKLELNAVADATGSAIITVTADDGAAVNNTVSTSFTVTIAAENDKPDLTLNMALKNYIEGNAPLVLDNTLTITDVDNGNLQGAVVSISANYTSSEDSLYYGGATFAPVFDLASGTLRFSGGAPLADYVAALRDVRYKNTSDNPVTDERTITFVVNDGNSDSDGESLNVAVTPINDPPVVTLSVANVAYTEAAGPVVLDNGIVISDIDNTELQDAFIRISGGYVQGQDTLIYSGTTLTPTFDEGNGRLRLNGVATLADYQQALREVSYNNLSANPTAGNRTVEFVLDDAAGVSLAQTMTVTVMPVNNKPVVTVSGVTLAYNENSGPQQLDNTITVADVDNSEFVNATVQISNNYVQGEDNLIYIGASLIPQFDVPSGTLILSGRLPKEDFQQILRDTYYENLSDNPNTNDRTVSFVVVDGFGLNSDPGTMQIEITSDNDKPEINLTVATVNYTENDGPEVLDNALTLSDIDDTEIDSAVVTISGNYVPGEDVLSYGGAAFTPVFDPLSGTLTFTGSSPIADYEQALGEVRYENTSDDPNTLDRTIAFVVNDGSADSDVKTLTVDLTATNDKPVVGIDPASLTFAEGDPVVLLDPAMTITDPDDGQLAGASVYFNGGYFENEDSLYVSPIPGIAAAFDTTNGIMALSGDASIADYQLVLRSIGYRNVSSDPTNSPRTISVVVDDGTDNSIPVSRVITIGTVNDPPVITLVQTNPLDYIENAPALVLDNALTVSDADNLNISSAKVKIASGYVAGQDTLATGVVPPGILSSFNVPDGELRLSGVRPSADYQAALRAVTYINTSDNPDATMRVIALTVNDGADDSNGATISINVIPQNDIPTIDNPIADQSGDEDFPEYVVVNLNTVFSDADGDVLAYNASVDNGKVIATIDGNLLKLAGAPDANGIAIVSVSADDGSGPVTDDFQVTIAPVNDVPVVDNVIAPVSLDEDFLSPSEVVADLNSIFSDPEAQPLSFSASSDNESVVTVNVAGNKLELNAVADASGSAIITVTADDGAAVNNTVSTSFTVTIDAVNDAPVVVNPIAAVTLNEDFASPLEVIANLNSVFSDPEGQMLSFSAISSDLTVVTVNVDGNKLELNAVADATGTATITVTADDGQALNNTIVNSFLVTVNAVNDAPVVDNVIAAVNLVEDFVSPSVVVADLNSIFSDPEAQPLSFSASSDNESVVTVNVAGNKLELNAVANAFGSANITVTADDGQPLDNIVSTNFLVTITADNDVPVVDNPIADQAEDEDFPEFTLADLNTVFSDIDGDNLIFTVTFSQPNIISATIDGSDLKLAGVRDSSGTVTVTVRATDPIGDFVEDDFDIVVAPQNDAPVVDVAIANQEVDEDFAEYTVVDLSTIFSDIDGDELMYSATLSVPDIVIATVDGDNLTLAGEPDANGTVTVTVKGEDPSGDFVEDAFDVLVNPVNDAPVVDNPIADQVIPEENLLHIDLLSNVFSDIDGPALVYSVSSKDDNVVAFRGTSDPDSLYIRAITDFVGTDSIFVSATDGEFSVSSNFLVTVTNENDQPVIANPIADLVIDEDAAEFFVANLSSVFTDADGNITAYSVRIKDGKLSSRLDGQDLYLTPGLNENGIDSVFVTAEDAFSETVTDTFAVAITPVNDAPVIATVALSNATQDVAYADTLKAIDADLDALTFAKLSGPVWMTVNADGSIEGTPANADTTAAVTIKIEVTDGQGGSDTLTTDIAVINVNDAPEITTLSLTNAQQDVAYADTVKATDIDFGDVLIFNALDVPAWMTVKADGSLEGTPSNADVAANVRVQVRVSDGELADTLDVTIDVLNINDAPVISTVALSDATQNVAYADTVKASDADLDALTFAKLSGPAWMTVNADGSIEGTPANADTTAAVTIKIEVTDGQGGSDTLTTDIAVLNVNDAPNVVNPIADVVIFDTDSDVKLAALADVFSDIDAGDMLSYNVIGNVTVNISIADDTLRISGIEGVGGIDTLLVTATDTGLLSAIDTVIVEVQLSNEAPVLAEFPAFAVNEGESFAAINLNTYVSDANDAKSDLKWEISQEIDLEFVVVDDTTLTVAIPDENWFGSETVRFKVTDPQGASDSSDVSFTVLAVNDAPVLASIDTIRIDEGDPIDPLALAALASDIDDPADSLAWSIETGTQLNASISEGDTLYLSVNDANWSGTETLDLIVSDPSGATDTTLVTVVVNGVNDAPVFSGLAPVSLSEDDSTTIILRDLVEDVDSAPEALVFAATVVAASGSIYSSDDLALRLDDASSELRFVPAANAFGDFRVELSVSDGDGGTAIDTIDVAVSGINDAPQLGSLADTTIFFDQTINLTLMGSDVDGDALNYSDNSDLTSISGNLLTVSEPGGDARGTHLITVYASDGALLDSTRFTLTIIGDADAPEIQTFEFSEDTSATTLARGFWVNTLAVDTLGGKSGTPSAELRYIYNVTRSADGADLSVELTGSGYYQWTELLPGSYDLAFYVADAKGNGLAEPLYSNTLEVLPAELQLASETWTMMTLSRDVTSTALLNKLRAGELYRWNGADYGSIPGEILVPGQAFWILTENPAGERFNFETQDPITQDTLKVALNRGWNQVGNPYEMPLRSEFITITANGNADVPLLEAVASEVILSDVFVFTGLTEDLTDIYRLQPIENMIFRPWEGVWIYVNAENAVLTWSKTPVTDIQPLVSSAVLAKREGEAPNRFKVQLEGRSTQVFTVHFTDGPNVKRVPSLGRTGSRLSLSNNLMHYHVADFAEATELRQYGIDVDVKAGDMVTVDFGGSAVAGAYLVFESRREVIELAAGLNVFDSDVQGSGILLLTNDLNFDPDNLPFSAGLSQNYPNPFNITTRIRVAVPLSLHQKDVRLDVYNILGQRVATLLNGKVDSGVRPIEWNGKNTANNVVATGVYFFRMTIAGKQFVKKAVLLK